MSKVIKKTTIPYGVVSPHELLGEPVVLAAALVDLEPDCVLLLPLSLPLGQRDDDRAAGLLVVRVGVAQADEVLRILRVVDWPERREGEREREKKKLGGRHFPQI